MTTFPTLDDWLLHRSRRWAFHAGLFAVALLVRMACFTGLIDSDDLGYAWFAQLASHGGYALSGSHLGMRVGLTMPTGLAYAVFGVGEFTTVLAPLLASAACVPLLVAIGRRLTGSSVAAVIAGVLLMTFPVTVRYASVLVPEPVADLWLLAAALTYLCARDVQSDGRSNQRQVGLALATGALFGLAYLTKEVALFIAAGFILHAISERRWAVLGALLGGLVAIGASEAAIYAVATGDPLWRSHVVQRSQMDYFADSMAAARSSWRIWKEYPYEMLVPNVEMGLHSVCTLLVAAIGVGWVHGRQRRLLVMWAVVPWLYLNFGTASFSTYLPVAAGPRYVEVVYPPLFLLAGSVVARWMAMARGRRAPGILSLAVVACIGLACAWQTRSTGYHTAEVGSLRSIARYESATGRHATTVTGPRAPMWSFGLELLAPRTRSPVACVSVDPDAAGLPHVGGTVACPSVSATPATLTYPLK